MTAADRHLLFGLLALQNGLIDQVALVAAFQAWTRDKAIALADHFVARGDLDAEQRAGVEAMVALHLKKHGGVEKSLAALPAGKSTREGLAELGDADIHGTLSNVTSAHESPEEGVSDRTASYAVGESTGDGQRFRILRPHARGGIGAVFVALDAELHREVALKQILDHHADDTISRQRFLLEAEITGGLEHPGIVPVYGLGAYGDGRPYYAMRFIRGDSLKEAIAAFHADIPLKAAPGRRSLELRKLLRRFLDVCNAIEYAHSRGVLHRDIKPGNVIVGKHGETLVVDWGLAKAVGKADPRPGDDERPLSPSSASGSAETLPGMALGTPAYMSPEQAAGDLDRLGPRSDVYSLGATLYFLLTGRAPFEGDDVGSLLRRVRKGDVTPPYRLEPTIDRALGAICLKAMATRPEDRHHSCRALAEDIERWMADEPVSAWREPLSRRARRWARRNRTAVTAAVAAVLVALVGTAAVLAVQTRANAALKLAIIDLAVANARVTRVNSDLEASNRRERARFELAQEAIATFHTGVSEDVLLKQKEFDALRTRLLRGAREFYRKLEGLLQGHEDRDSRMALGRAYAEVGTLTAELDSVVEAQEVHRRGLALFEALHREDPADPQPRRAIARSLNSLALILTSVGRGNDALAAQERARGLLRTLAEADPADRRLWGELARVELFYGMSLSSKHRGAEAMEAVQRARSILEAPAAPDTPADHLQNVLAEAYGALALLLEDVGRRDEAHSAFRKACDLGEAMLRANPQDPVIGHELARSLGNMGIFLQAVGRPAEAAVAFDRAAEVLKAAGDANPTLIMIHAASAWIGATAAHTLAALGRDDEALRALERAVAARKVLIKANPSVVRNQEQLVWVYNKIAEIRRRAGRAPEALEALEQSKEIAARLSEDHPENLDRPLELMEICIELGKLQISTGQPAEALASLDEALAIHGKLTSTATLTSSTRAWLASILLQRGVALQRFGRAADSASSLHQSIMVLGEQSEPTSWDFYNEACARSLLSALPRAAVSGPTTANGPDEADRAMAILSRIVAGGFHDPIIRTDPDLDPLRDRADFRLLMMDVAMPAEPFATGR